MSTVALAMIVKNEAPVINRCLDSVQPFVSHIVVNDNGSTDRTVEILDSRRAQVVPTEWWDYSTNRNIALAVARKWADYVFCGLDADEEFIAPPGWAWPELTADAYWIECRYGKLRYPRMAVVKSSKMFRWRGVLHEAIVLDGETFSTGTIPDVYIKVNSDGARARDPKTQEKDRDTLFKAIVDEPDNPRYNFYLAQTLKDLGDYEMALHYYEKRIHIAGWVAETWYAMYQKAAMLEKLSSSRDPLGAYLAAYDYRPARVEPLYWAADWCRRANRHHTGCLLAEVAMLMPAPPANDLFIEADVYEWRRYDLVSVLAFYTNRHELGKLASRTLIQTGQFPETERARIEANAAFYKER